jgi:Bacterial PH domain
VNEHEVEPIRGLPELLPQGERILWQGAPAWKPLALRALHVGAVLAYFALLFVWSVGMGVWDGASFGAALLIALRLVPVALAAAGILGLYAWLSARSSVYTITNRRVVLRFGVALPMTLNVPFAVIGNAALKPYRDGTGDIPLTLTGTERVSYVALWPHARPWCTAKPEPMLRSVPDAANVAKILGQALADAARERTAPEDSFAFSFDRKQKPYAHEPAAA